MNNNHTPQRACPICNKRSGTVLGRLSYALFDDLDIFGTKTLLCCDGCGMIYDDVAFTEEQLQEYYRRNEHYAASVIGGAGGVSDDNNERYDRIIDTLMPDRDGLIIDYGCGQGGFITRCRHRGLKALGIEPSAKSREVARQSGLSVYESMEAFLTHQQDHKIHAVVFSHVIEHLINPAQLLRIFAHSAGDAWVYLEVPDADFYLSPDAVRWPELYFEHLSHFRKHDLAELATHAGIEITKEDGVPFSKYLNDTKCLVLVGRFSGTLKKADAVKTATIHPVSLLPPLSVADIPHDDHPTVLWGVSQYAMLLIGSCPQLAGHITRLFDSSPAKIGRKINGIIIEASDKLSSLSDEVHLLIPKSKFLPQMLSQLQGTSFLGTVRII